uniref:Uncharacterized protein n=1 Tax=Oryza punctata TaxID=4537 RepID=A0A0E0LVA2_ORYPU
MGKLHRKTRHSEVMVILVHNQLVIASFDGRLAAEEEISYTNSDPHMRTTSPYSDLKRLIRITFSGHERARQYSSMTTCQLQHAWNRQSQVLRWGYYRNLARKSVGHSIVNACHRVPA